MTPQGACTVAEFDADSPRHPLRGTMNRPGVYAFIHAGRCLYIGKSKNSMTNRVLDHIRYHRRLASVWDREAGLGVRYPLEDRLVKPDGGSIVVEFYPTSAEDARPTEKAEIVRRHPELNIMRPSSRKGYRGDHDVQQGEA